MEDESFDVLSAMSQEPTYNNLCYFRFIDREIGSSDIYELDLSTYLNMSVATNILNLSLKRHRGSDEFIKKLQEGKFSIDILFSNFHSQTMSVKTRKIINITKVNYSNTFDLSFLCNGKIEYSFTDKSRPFEYMTLVEGSSL